MSTLNELMEIWHDIESELYDNGGELTDELAVKISENEKDLGDKLDNYERVVRHINGQVEYLKTEEKRYAQRRKVLENSIISLKNRQLYALNQLGEENIKTVEFKYSVGQRDRWSVDEMILKDDSIIGLVQDGLGKVVFKPNMTELKKRYKDKDDKPDYLVIDRTEYLKVR